MSTPDRFDTLTRWRYWVIPHGLLKPASARLCAADPRDQAVWRRGETTAVCRHDPTHTPPHPDCTCGIYAIGKMDILTAERLPQWGWSTRFGRVFTKVNGHLSSVARPESPFEQELFMHRHWVPDSRAHWRRWLHIYSPRNLFVIGRVQLTNAVAVEPRWPDGVKRFQPWRAEATTIEALHFRGDAAALPDARCDPDELAAALSARYGVPCQPTLPGYTQQDWDQRTVLDSTPPGLAQLGLHPPGTPRCGGPTFFRATVPPRP